MKRNTVLKVEKVTITSKIHQVYINAENTAQMRGHRKDVTMAEADDSFSEEYLREIVNEIEAKKIEKKKKKKKNTNSINGSKLSEHIIMRMVNK